MTKPQSPHEKLQQLDESGDAYWIRLFSYQRADRDPGSLVAARSMGDMNVVSYGPEWVELSVTTRDDKTRKYTAQASIWMRWSDLGPFQICEEGD